jgi:hypothetical protein
MAQSSPPTSGAYGGARGQNSSSLSVGTTTMRNYDNKDNQLT